jgi:hypothetical protein
VLSIHKKTLKIYRKIIFLDFRFFFGSKYKIETKTHFTGPLNIFRVTV